MNGSDRIRQVLAVFMGGLFVAAGLLVMFGEVQTASASTGYRDSSLNLFTELTDSLGNAGAGTLLIALGVGLAVLLVRSVSR